MTQETEQNTKHDQTQPVNQMNETIDKFVTASRVSAVYGEPTREGNVTAIPCSEVSSWMFFGMGFGLGGSKDQGNNGQGGGQAGGGNTYARPVAAIEIASTGVHVKPVIDVTKISLAIVTSFGVAMSLTYKLLKRRKGHA
jgi:uncharacterized spore protein YtfJ